MAIVIHDFSCLKLSNSLSIFYKYLEYIISKSTAVSFREKNASFIVNNLPFVGVIFLSRKEAKGSSFRCLAIPPQNHSITSPKHLKALENYGITRQKTFQTACETRTYTILCKSAMNYCFQVRYPSSLVFLVIDPLKFEALSVL